MDKIIVLREKYMREPELIEREKLKEIIRKQEKQIIEIENIFKDKIHYESKELTKGIDFNFKTSKRYVYEPITEIDNIWTILEALKWISYEIISCPEEEETEKLEKDES